MLMIQPALAMEFWCDPTYRQLAKVATSPLENIAGALIPRLHVRAHHSRSDPRQFLARFVKDDAQQMVSPGPDQVARPLRDRPLKTSLRRERLYFAFVLAEFFPVQTQRAKHDPADLPVAIRRDSHESSDLRCRVLGPGRVTTDRHHDRAAYRPKGWFQSFHQLNPAQARRLLHRQRTAIRERAKNPLPAVAVTQFGIERDDVVPLRFEFREIGPRQFELDLHPARGAARANLNSDFRNRVQVAR